MGSSYNQVNGKSGIIFTGFLPSQQALEKWNALPPVDNWDIIDLFRQIGRVGDFSDSQFDFTTPGSDLLKKVLQEAYKERNHLHAVNNHAFHPRPAQPATSTSSSSSLSLSSNAQPTPPSYIAPGKQGKPGTSAARTAKGDALGLKPQLPRNIRQQELSYDDAVSTTKTPPCPKCLHKDEKDKCIRRLIVKRRSKSELAEWKNSVLTCAPADDVFLGPEVCFVVT